jgi:hypothetical protein
MQVSRHDKMSLVYDGLTAYCITAVYNGRLWTYHSLNGGIQPRGEPCPAAGTPGPGGTWIDGGTLNG